MAAALWAGINSQGKEGYTKIYKNCLEIKSKFIEALNLLDLNINFFTQELSNIVAIELPFELSSKSETKFGLNVSEIKIEDKIHSVYKLVFMPHVDERILEEFIEDLSEHKK